MIIGQEQDAMKTTAFSFAAVLSTNLVCCCLYCFISLGLLLCLFLLASFVPVFCLSTAAFIGEIKFIYKVNALAWTLLTKKHLDFVFSHFMHNWHFLSTHILTADLWVNSDVVKLLIKIYFLPLTEKWQAIAITVCCFCGTISVVNWCSI